MYMYNVYVFGVAFGKIADFKAAPHNPCAVLPYVFKGECLVIMYFF